MHPRAGQQTFLPCLKRRTSSQDLEVYDKIEHLIDSNNEYSFKDNVSEIKWHKNCYSSFTSEFHIKYATTSEERNSSKETSSLKRLAFNWKELCMFCGQKSYKKDKTMYRVSTFDFCKTLESRVKEKEDDVLSCRVGDFSKLMALEARYHFQCHKKYLKKSVPTSSASSLHDSAFDDLISKIKPELEDGTVFDMNQVFQMY